MKRFKDNVRYNFRDVITDNIKLRIIFPYGFSVIFKAEFYGRLKYIFESNL
jgi:hypothetical protein